MFSKITFKLKDNPDFGRLKGSFYMSYGKIPFPVISYYDVKDMDYLNSLLPDDMPWNALPPDKVKVSEINNLIAGHLIPHIDHGISVCANYYVKTAGSTTYFYELKDNENGHVYPGKDTANIYDFNQVKKVGEFTANENDLYLLNVSQIHSVSTPKAGKRQFITWQWLNASFEDIVKALKQ